MESQRLLLKEEMPEDSSMADHQMADPKLMPFGRSGRATGPNNKVTLGRTGRAAALDEAFHVENGIFGWHVARFADAWQVLGVAP